MSEPRVLFIDIETIPTAMYGWEAYTRKSFNALEILMYGFIICAAYKWQHKKKVELVSVVDQAGYKPPLQYRKGGIFLHDISKQEKALCKLLWDLLNEADIVVGQNVDQFDIKEMNVRFELYDLGVPGYYVTQDTLKMSRKSFRLPSHRLDARSRRFRNTKKLDHEGWEMWKGYMTGDQKFVNKMHRYNKKDTLLTEEDYASLLKWDNRVSVGVFANKGKPMCSRPGCGSRRLSRWGFYWSKTGKFQQYRCHNKHTSTSRINLLTKNAHEKEETFLK